MALDVLSRGRPDLAEEIIPHLLAVTQPGEIQSAAARAVGRAGRPSLAAKALERWKDLAVATRRELLSALVGFARLVVEELIKALERATIDPGELDASTREALERLPDATAAAASVDRPSPGSRRPGGQRRWRAIRRLSRSLPTSSAGRPSLPAIARPVTSARARAIAWALICRASPDGPPMPC